MQSDHYRFWPEDMLTSITSDFVIRRRSTTRGPVASSGKRWGHGCGAAVNTGTITMLFRFSLVALDLMAFAHGRPPRKPVTDSTRCCSNPGLRSTPPLIAVITIAQVEVSAPLMAYTKRVLISPMQHSSGAET